MQNQFYYSGLVAFSILNIMEAMINHRKYCRFGSVNLKFKILVDRVIIFSLMKNENILGSNSECGVTENERVLMDRSVYWKVLEKFLFFHQSYPKIFCVGCHLGRKTI